MKKYLYIAVAGAYLCAPVTSMSMGHTPQEPSTFGLYLGAFGLLAVVGGIVASVQKYGVRFTKAAVAAGIVAPVAWNILNQAALNDTLINLAKASSRTLIPKNSVFNITPAAIIGSLACGSLAFYAIYAYSHGDDYPNSHTTQVTTQTRWQ